MKKVDKEMTLRKVNHLALHAVVITGTGLLVGPLGVTGCGDVSSTNETASSNSESLATASPFTREEELGRFQQGARPARELVRSIGAKATQAKERGSNVIMLRGDGRVSSVKYEQRAAERAAASSITRLGDEAIMIPGSAPRADLPEQSVEKDLSGGSDDRGFLGGINFWQQEVSRVGTISGAPPASHCTGTLVGNRVVWTAAHCVGFDSSGNFIGTGYFTPQQHGETGPSSGWSGWAPWGTAAFNTVFIAPKWIELGCWADALAPDCAKYDFAFAILDPDPFAGGMGHPGFNAVMGFNGAISNMQGKKNIGYPACSPIDPPGQIPPVGCISSQPYGDVFTNCGGVTPTYGGAAANNAWPWSSGQNPLIRLGCDVSKGHSGGPVYTVEGTCSNGPCVFANIISGWPSGSQGIKMNAELVSFTVLLRSLYP